MKWEAYAFRRRRSHVLDRTVDLYLASDGNVFGSNRQAVVGGTDREQDFRLYHKARPVLCVFITTPFGAERWIANTDGICARYPDRYSGVADAGE